MQTSLHQLIKNDWATHPLSQLSDLGNVQLVLCFSNKKILERENTFQKIRHRFPAAEIILCSTAGEIFQDMVTENSLLAVAMNFEKTSFKTAVVDYSDFTNSYDAAVELSRSLIKDNPASIMVFSDGSMVNGSELAKGLAAMTKNILVTGGLAGDGVNFNSTLLGLNETAAKGKIVAVGFYGEHINITHGSAGGWEQFGLEKRITKSSGNILFEIEHASALELYKKYLGDEAVNLPAAAFSFPISISIPGAIKPVVRTILSINEKDGSMTFAGDVPEGAIMRFMKTKSEALTAAAATAARQTIVNQTCKPDFSLLISCVGRKIILGSQAVDEILAVNNTLGNETLTAGFYSYGEISPFDEGGSCQLHNQTMTITSFYES